MCLDQVLFYKLQNNEKGSRVVNLLEVYLDSCPLLIIIILVCFVFIWFLGGLLIWCYVIFHLTTREEEKSIPPSVYIFYGDLFTYLFLA